MKLGIDTNLLVRYLTQDDSRQARAVDRFLEQALGEGSSLHVNVIVLCELVWVLESAYGYDKQAILEALDVLVAVKQLLIEDRDHVLVAIEDFRAQPGNFADYVIGRRNLAAGCSHTTTFDRKLGKAGMFRLLR
jgi:predicted nucleic-acid-binding protein